LASLLATIIYDDIKLTKYLIIFKISVLILFLIIISDYWRRFHKGIKINLEAMKWIELVKRGRVEDGDKILVWEKQKKK